MVKTIVILAMLAIMVLAMFGCTSSYDDKQRERLWEMEERIATLEDQVADQAFVIDGLNTRTRALTDRVNTLEKP